MIIVKEIIENLIKYIEQDKIKYEFNSYENTCSLMFAKNEIKLITFILRLKMSFIFKLSSTKMMNYIILSLIQKMKYSKKQNNYMNWLKKNIIIGLI